MREKLNSLKKYDVIFLKKINKKNNKIIRLIKQINPKIEVFNTKYRIKNSNKFNFKKKFIAFSGIGNPENFIELLKKNKFKIIRNIIFPDHYKYNKEDIINLIKKSKKLKTQLITTEKDFIKIPKSYHKHIKYIKIDLEIEKLQKFIKYLKIKINE